MLNFNLKPRTGFTFIELLVVVTIIAVLSAVGMVIFTSAGKNTRDAKRKADLESIRQALVLYRDENGCYPDLDMDSGQPLTDDGYISSPFPQDPKEANDATYTYSYTGSGVATCQDSSSGYSSFSLTAKLERDGGSNYTITNP